MTTDRLNEIIEVFGDFSEVKNEHLNNPSRYEDYAANHGERELVEYMLEGEVEMGIEGLECGTDDIAGERIEHQIKTVIVPALREIGVDI